MKIPTVVFDGGMSFALVYKKDRPKALILQALEKKYKPGATVDKDCKRESILAFEFTTDKSIDVTIEALQMLRDAKKE